MVNFFKYRSKSLGTLSTLNAINVRGRENGSRRIQDLYVQAGIVAE
jgi:hypothetical protein